ncbi:MAG: DUF4091 domain-containing protein [Phycisphaerae bacterium]|nr:DUF4091 domain-containing protein [Phycisphaerae bacterium]
MKLLNATLVTLLITTTSIFAQAPTAVLTDELTPIYPDQFPDGSAAFTSHAPRACTTAVHLVINNLTADADLSFTANALLSTQFYNLIAVPVEVNSGVSSRTETFDKKINPDVIRRAPFNIYEVLEPFDKTIKATAKQMAFALHCTIPANASVGNHQIKIEVKQNNKTIATLTWNLKIAKIAIPPIGRDSMGYTNWLSFGNIAKYHNCQKWTEDYWTMLDKYLTILAANRQNMLFIPLSDMFEKNSNGQWLLNEDRFTRLIKLCDKHHIYWLEGTQLGGRPNGDWSSKNIELRFNKSLTPTDAAKTEVKQICGQLYAALEKNNCTSRWIQHLSDEPTDTMADGYTWLAKEVKAAMPKVKIFEATMSQKLTGAIDIWCPTVNKYQANQEFFDARKTAGDQVWVYTCLTPTGPWLNRLLDMEKLRPVYIGWGIAKYNLDGFLHWGGNFWSVNPYKQSVIKHPAVRDKDTNNELPAGDTHILYPKDKNIYASIRLRSHTIGCEDYELLQMAQKRNPQATQKIIEKVFRAFNDYEKQVSLYRQTRSELINLLD